VVVESLVTHTVKYPYKTVPLPNGGFDWLPILRVQLSRGSRVTAPFETVIDSGSFDCLFHADIARALGIKDITSGELKMSGGVVKGVQMKTYGHEMRLVIGADTFKVKAFFAEEMPIAGLLGRLGFFDNFTVTFHAGDEPGFELTRVHKKKQSAMSTQ